MFNLFTVSASVSYALDIWGSARRQLEGLHGQVDLRRYTLLGANLMLSANVVNTLIAHAAYRAQIEAAGHRRAVCLALGGGWWNSDTRQSATR